MHYLAAMKITLLLAFIFAIVASSCRAVKQPVFETIEDVELGKVGLAGAELKAGLRFTNPNHFPLKLDYVSGDLYIDSIYMGVFGVEKPMTIPANASFVLPITGTAQFGGVMALIGNAKQILAGTPAKIEVSGKARVGRSGFYKTLPFSYRDTLALPANLLKQ